MKELTKLMMERIAELIRTNKKIRELDQLKSRFVATVSHELRTPSSVIENGIANLLDGVVGEFTKEQREYLGMIGGTAQIMTHLLNNLLDFSRFERGEIALNKVPSEIKELIDKSIFLIQTKVNEKKINLIKQIPEDPPKVIVDSNGIIEVLVNLFDNAVKFSGTGSEIMVFVQVMQNEELKIGIKDNGIGIAEEDIPGLFSEFHQIARSIRSAEKGLGLGLAICRKIIQLHGGEIWVESEPGKGSTFNFTVPAVKA